MSEPEKNDTKKRTKNNEIWVKDIHNRDSPVSEDQDSHNCTDDQSHTQPDETTNQPDRNRTWIRKK